jgi:hypothetical protein
MSEETEDVSKYQPIYVTQQELSARLGLTVRWIYDLTKDGVFQQVEGKKYDLDASHKAYAEHRLKLAIDKKPPSASETLASTKDKILQRRLARENRTIIEMSEAIEVVDYITGAFNEAISGLPARITRNIDERKRIETICDGVRTSLEKAFGEQREALRTGQQSGEASEEDDAG